MNFRALLALIAGVILFSGVASAQPVTTHSSKTTSELKLCDMTVDEIKQLLGNYKTDYTSDDLTGWLNSGSFDDGQAEWDQINAATGAANKYGYNKNNKNLSNPKKMCLAAVLTSRVKFDDGKAKDFATALYGRYGDLKNASFGADKFATLIKTNDPTSDKVSKKKAASVVQMFFSGTKNVNTRLLKPVFFKDDSDIVDANAARSYVIDMARNTTTENFTSVMEKSSSSGAPSPDLGNISPMSDDLRDGWIKNWEVECTRTDLSYKGNQEDCKQMILEGQYNNIAFFNHVKGYDGQNINQLKIYVDAASSVKKQAKDVDKVEKENNFNVDNHKYNNLKDADDANKKVEDNKIALKKGQDSVDYMKNYLVTLFNGSICFNATIGSVNPNVDKNLKDKLADLSAKLSMEDTFGEKDANGLYSKPFIFRESGSSLAPAPVIDRIKTACILFNRIKNVNITDANKDYDKLAKSVVALFGVDDETQKTNVELALAYALRNENDADIIKQLDALKGVTIYQKGTTDEQKEVINELIIDHSKAGKAVIADNKPINNDSDKDKNKNLGPNKNNNGKGIVDNGNKASGSLGDGSKKGNNGTITKQLGSIGNLPGKTAIDVNRKDLGTVANKYAADHKIADDGKKGSSDQEDAVLKSLADLIEDYIVNGTEKSLSDAEDILKNTCVKVNPLKLLGLVAGALGDAMAVDQKNMQTLLELLSKITVKMDNGSLIAECDPCFDDLMKGLVESETAKFDKTDKDYDKNVKDYASHMKLGLTRARYCGDVLAALLKTDDKKDDNKDVAPVAGGRTPVKMTKAEVDAYKTVRNGKPITKTTTPAANASGSSRTLVPR